MDISQVLNLATWVAENLPQVLRSYRKLQQKLDHNAKQPQKEPLREELSNLTQLLDSMSFEHLTNEEVDLLEELEALQYLGHPGWNFVQQTITTSDFDPASAAADFQIAIQILDNTIQKFDTAQNAIRQLGFENFSDEQAMLELPLVRVRFKEDASIKDIALLKKWTTEWFDIARGAALSVGETPQTVKVVSANNGSIILTLGTIASVTMVLAIIAKNAGRIASEYLSIANDIEDLRHKRRLNQVIEEELRRQQDAVQKSGVEDTLREISDSVQGAIENEVANALRKAITKYFDFYKKGGDVDFIPPRAQLEQSAEDVDDEKFLLKTAEQAQENEKLVQVIEEVRAQQAAILQLVHNVRTPDDEA